MLEIRDHKLIIDRGVMEIKLGTTKVPTIEEWITVGLNIDNCENTKVCFRRGRSGIYEYKSRSHYFKVSMAGKPEGKAPLQVALKLMKLWLEDNDSTGLIAQSRRVCK